MNFSTFIISFSIFIIATIVYTYYTLWVYLDPFLAENSPYKKYFILPRCLKFVIPLICLICILGAGLFLVKAANKLKSKKKAAKPNQEPSLAVNGGKKKKE